MSNSDRKFLDDDLVRVVKVIPVGNKVRDEEKRTVLGRVFAVDSFSNTPTYGNQGYCLTGFTFYGFHADELEKVDRLASVAIGDVVIAAGCANPVKVTSIAITGEDIYEKSIITNAIAVRICTVEEINQKKFARERLAKICDEKLHQLEQLLQDFSDMRKELDQLLL